MPQKTIRFSFRGLHHKLFWPAFVLLTAFVSLGLWQPEIFHQRVSALNDFILVHFGFLFHWGTFLFLLLVLLTYFSPLGKKRIGGAEAKPMLKTWQMFSITLCTTIATGILFWGVAEPLFHVHQPPESIPAAQAEAFSMSTLFMHWSFTPYAIYALVGVVFTINHYNYLQPFTIGSTLYTLWPRSSRGFMGQAASLICLVALVAGMAASLGAGILTISGGMHHLFGVQQGIGTNALIAMAIVGVFLLSSASGILRGIKWLSSFNAIAFILLAIFILAFGPIAEMAKMAWLGLQDYARHFIPRSLGLGQLDVQWQQDWTLFYWANWVAWAPITALFLGKISRGRTVRQYLVFNFFLPALFGVLWMSIFGSAALYFDKENGELLYKGLQHDGVQNVIYALLEYYPAAMLVSMLFLLVVFVSFVTAADSNTTALGGISFKGAKPDQPSPTWIKVLWGLIIGLMAFVMISYAGIDGIRILSVLGGFPVLFVIFLVALSLMRMILNSLNE